MSAIVYRLRSALRSQWGSTIGLALVIAIVCAVVLTVAAGANRTLTAPDRYVSWFGGDPDARMEQTDGPPMANDVATLPSVERVSSFTFVFGGLIPGDDQDLTHGLNAVVFSGSFAVIGSHLIEGRVPDSNTPGEFVGGRNLRDSFGARLGDEFTLLTYTQEQAGRNEYGVTEPRGSTYSAVLVGFSDGPAEVEDPSLFAFFSPALIEDPMVGISGTVMSAKLQPGSTLSELRAEVDTLPGGQSLSIEPGRLFSATMRPAVDAQGIGLWLVALVGGIAAVAVLGQLVTRHLRLTGSDDDRLAAIGYTRSQIIGEYATRAAVPIALGAATAIALAVIPSDIFPSGFIRRLEPNPGIRLDPLVIGGACMFGVCVLLWATAAVSLDHWRRSVRQRVTRPSSVVEAIAGRGTATAATGVRFAFTRRTGERGSRASVVGLALIVSGLVASSVFGVSLNRLVSTPSSYGSNYDFTFGDNGGGHIREGLDTALEADPDVAALTLYAYDDVRVGSKTVSVLGMERRRGDGAPLMSEGRLPASPDEVAFGLVTARSLGLGIGDTVTMAGTTSIRDFRVTGIAVLTAFGPNEGMGEGALMTFPALQAIVKTASLSTITVRMTNKDPDTVARLAAIIGDGVATDGIQAAGVERPSAIDNVARVRSIPFVLAALLAALAVLSLVHVMITARRRRRRDFAVLVALGAERGWIRRAVHWQAISFTVAPLLLGLPLGVLAGRQVFIGFAESMGAVTTSSTPFVLIAIVVGGLLVLANVSVSLPARRGRAMTTAQLLQSR